MARIEDVANENRFRDMMSELIQPVAKKATRIDETVRKLELQNLRMNTQIDNLEILTRRHSDRLSTVDDLRSKLMESIIETKATESGFNLKLQQLSSEISKILVQIEDTERHLLNNNETTQLFRQEVTEKVSSLRGTKDWIEKDFGAFKDEQKRMYVELKEMYIDSLEELKEIRGTNKHIQQKVLPKMNLDTSFLETRVSEIENLFSQSQIDEETTVKEIKSTLRKDLEGAILRFSNKFQLFTPIEEYLCKLLPVEIIGCVSDILFHALGNNEQIKAARYCYEKSKELTVSQDEMSFTTLCGNVKEKIQERILQTVEIAEKEFEIISSRKNSRRSRRSRKSRDSRELNSVHEPQSPKENKRRKKTKRRHKTERREERKRKRRHKSKEEKIIKTLPTLDEIDSLINKKPEEIIPEIRYDLNLFGIESEELTGLEKIAERENEDLDLPVFGSMEGTYEEVAIEDEENRDLIVDNEVAEENFEGEFLIEEKEKIEVGEERKESGKEKYEEKEEISEEKLVGLEENLVGICEEEEKEAVEDLKEEFNEEFYQKPKEESVLEEPFVNNRKISVEEEEIQVKVPDESKIEENERTKIEENVELAYTEKELPEIKHTEFEEIQDKIPIEKSSRQIENQDEPNSSTNLIEENIQTHPNLYQQPIIPKTPEPNSPLESPPETHLIQTPLQQISPPNNPEATEFNNTPQHNSLSSNLTSTIFNLPEEPKPEISPKNPVETTKPISPPVENNLSLDSEEASKPSQPAIINFEFQPLQISPSSESSTPESSEYSDSEYSDSSSESIDLTYLEEGIEELKTSISDLSSSFQTQLASITNVRLVQINKQIREINQDNQTNIKLEQQEMQGILKNRKKEQVDSNRAFEEINEKLADKQASIANIESHINTMTELVSSLTEFSQILLKVLEEDEEDREGIELQGYANSSSVSKSLSKNTISLKPECISCTGSNGVILNAFKMACLSYKPTPIKYNSRIYSRSQILQMLGSFLGSAWNSASEKGPFEPCLMPNMSEESSFLESPLETRLKHRPTRSENFELPTINTSKVFLDINDTPLSSYREFKRV